MDGAGGTPGGVGQFFVGLICAVAGSWLLMNQVTVGSFGWSLWGYNSFGLSLIPFLVGVGLLFFNGLREVDLRVKGFGHHIPALLASRGKAQMCRGGSAGPDTAR